MSEFIPFETPGGNIFVQIEDSNAGPIQLNVPQNLVASSYEGILNILKTNVGLLKSQLEELEPSTINISFGIRAGVKSGPVAGPEQRIFALAKGTEDVHFKVKLNWEDNNHES